MRQVIEKRRFPAAAATAGLLTILSGAGMYWRNISVSSGGWATSAPGLTYGVGAVAAIIAIVIFARIIAPTGEQLLQLSGSIQSGGAPPSAEQAQRLAQLQGRMAFASRIGASCLAVAVICMALARYL
jgi:hypothetical protein